MTDQEYPVKVGDLRPSQIMWAHGPGALVDLPQISVVVLGLDDWDREHSSPISEARLLQAVRRRLGNQVEQLLAPPMAGGTDGPVNPFTEEARIGIPVATFPGWLRCPLCGTLAEHDCGLFELKTYPFRPDRTMYVHSNCAKARRPPPVVPARFLVACRGGHFDDFPWRWYVHRGPSECTGQLHFTEEGASLQTENLWVKCIGCDAARSMAEAFGEQARRSLPACRGRHPHLGTTEEDCSETIRPVLLGASNSWFPVYLSLLAVPTAQDRLSQLVDDKWDLFEDVESIEILRPVIKSLVKAGALPGIRDYSLEDIWAAIERRRAESAGNELEGPDADLKVPEWEVFTSSELVQDWPEFAAKAVEPPGRYGWSITSVVLVERLREVNALLGFTRVEPPEESVEGGDPPPRAPLSRGNPTWVPATEVRGEGIFILFNAERLQEWISRQAVRDKSDMLMSGHRGWRAARRLTPFDANYPGVLYALLHTFSHALLRELSLECGYNMASIRERIYASGDGEQPEMAGILLYTAAPDSDGTLGGLVELGKPENLGRLIDQALERASLCSSDPLCSEHDAAQDATLHGAACHACSFLPETSCEISNRYLDRSLLVTTFQGGAAAYFGSSVDAGT